ncbi:MAG: hypothetical protein HQL18_01540, partial [Candidatus Omnitrophica bacterium]|nr:hypothetical protein [Candidatus Omnitrophota bacterium]
MDYRILKGFEKEICWTAAALHDDALSSGGFITSFGRNFLLEIYRVILEDRLGFMVCALDEGRLKGFVIGL